jgi:predicted  nucleic acid-binding Zn-ribbon protein
MLLDGYHSDILNNFEGAPAKFNPRNPNRTNSSPLLDANDPIQMHLLVSTALEDATGYAILAPEEVDALRKQCIRLTQRIESTRQNLAVQSKYRDAAINMGKLYSDGSSDGKRRSRGSLGLKRNSHTDQSREAEAERAASEGRCEELAQELWGLEKRLIEPQTALLQHTAGILQMTHKTAKKGRASQGGMPGSPESMYTYDARGSVAPGEDIFDERSLYRSFDRLDGGEGERAVEAPNPNAMGADAEAKLRELWEMMHPTSKDGEDDAPVQDFSLLAFSSKVQSLHSQSAMLNDQKEVLQRQIKQQRELNNKSDETKDREMAEMETQLKSTQATLSQVEAQAQTLESKLAETLDQSSRSQGEATLALHSNIDNLQNELDALQNQLEDLQNEHEDLKSSHAIDLAELKSSNTVDLADLKSSNAIDLADLQSQLTSSAEHIAALKQAKSTAEAHIDDLTADLENARKAEAQVVSLTAELEEARSAQSSRAVDEDELDAKNMEIARLQTEVTIARAELDGAYGSRAQRAAEVASNPAIQKELDALRRELGETIEEYEVLTKASIEGERERELLEKEIDRLRDEREALEAKLSDERVRWMGMKSPGPDGAGGPAGVGAGNTSTAVLKNEFKKMMRDTRAENAKALRVSCSAFFSVILVGGLRLMVV